MHIGLIGGIGPAATDFYYRKLIRIAADKGLDLDLTIVHADTRTLIANLAADDRSAQCGIYMRLTERLVAAGAENVVVTSIAGHFCIDEFAAVSPLPLVDITKTLSSWLDAKGMTRMGILGTETVMKTGMYGKLAPVEVLAPEGAELGRVHEAYIKLAQSGEPSEELRDIFVSAAQELVARGAEGVMLGGTDLNALFADDDKAFPVIDCAGIHIEDVAQFI